METRLIKTSLVKMIFLIFIFSKEKVSFSQNQLFIPPLISGSSIDLTIQSGFQNFYLGNPTPTLGINGDFLSPTIVVNDGDSITLNVINTLPYATTMHWHGLHVAPKNDGGPHQIITQGTTWSPSFKIRNKAGTYWYHPHGEGKTELHVSKGLAGFFIVHDVNELSLGLPQNYGIDDIPLVTQTKSFDILNQITIADHMDTAVFINGTLNAIDTFPSQVVRLRLLNGSSMRTFNYGFSNNMTFYQIATDGGLKSQPFNTNRLMLAPGERAEILVDFQSLIGQNVSLMSFASEIPNGIFGSPSVGQGSDSIHDYSMNMLNGSDFELLKIFVGNQTLNPVTTIPSTLVSYVPYEISNVNINRKIILDTIRLLVNETPSLAEGPFGINGHTFSMDSINIRVPLNSTEVWTLINNTHIAHPFHIHDIQFNIIEKSGLSPLENETGWKDVVLVPAHDSVKFITKFITFSDEMIPYMYHCHLLHHEDDGMMGSFLVFDSTLNINTQIENEFSFYPNPSSDKVMIEGVDIENYQISFFNNYGKEINLDKSFQSKNIVELCTKEIANGIYFIQIKNDFYCKKIKLLVIH